MDPIYTTPFKDFPDYAEHSRRWRELARKIAATKPNITDDSNVLTVPKTPGELVILGSGIEAVGFTSSDELRIREADHVFYCVADPATSVWLKNLRPDALDLYVLYSNTKVRYTTYMQMTEAMLYYVRKGKRVATIFYGHPGVFVLSTHRAVQIARREGHNATMRAGISALDTLCADLGVDPSQPGLLTLEATEMLVRRRRLDRGLHVVLWQVGLIGELGFRRQGCLNSRFSILLDYLEEIYGPDQEIVNYIGSRYPGVEPVIERHTIASLRHPEAQANVTGISTFYIPPVDTAESNVDMLLALGLIHPGQTVNRPKRALRNIDSYGAKEYKAFQDFARFQVPIGYHWQPDTGAARFILALREDGDLRTRFRENPAAAVATWPGKLSTPERRRLALGDAGAMQIAAKGVRTTVAHGSSYLLHELLTKEPVSRSLLRAARKSSSPRAEIDLWTEQNGYVADWNTLSEDLEITLRQELFPWSGLYLAKDKAQSFVVHGLPANEAANRVYVNGQKIVGAHFRRGAIYWRCEEGNGTSGSLRVDVTVRGARRLVGSVWNAGEEVGSRHHVVALEHNLSTSLPLASLTGKYIVDGTEINVRPSLDGSKTGMAVFTNGQYMEGAVSVGATNLQVDGLTVPFLAAKCEEEVPDFAQGEYRIRLVSDRESSLISVQVFRKSLVIGDHKMALLHSGGRTWSWISGPSRLREGQISVLLDPISLVPMAFGQAQTANQHTVLLRGMMPVTGGMIAQRVAQGDFGIPDWAWHVIVKIVAEASEKGGLFLWHGWSRSVANLRRLRRVLRLRENEHV